MKATSVMNAIRFGAHRNRDQFNAWMRKAGPGVPEYGLGRREKTTLGLVLPQRYETVTRGCPQRVADERAYIAGPQMVRRCE